MNSYELGSSPYEEDCLQVGEASLSQLASEATVFLHQIRRAYPPPPDCTLRIVSCAHDFGTYYEVQAVFPETEEAWEWFDAIDNDSGDKLLTWDDDARTELERYGIGLDSPARKGSAA